MSCEPNSQPGRCVTPPTASGPVILPGATVAVGDALALEPVERGSPAVTVARISISTKVSQWLEPGGGNRGLGAVTATVVAGTGKRDAEGSGSMRFSANSANCADLVSRGTSMIFRDASGTIVGGSLSTDLPLNACDAGASGEDTAGSTLRSIPAAADLDRTQITAYCDFDRPLPSNEVGAPVN
jgi:hypothetical protein